MQHHCEHLSDTADLAAHKPGCSRTNMAAYAFHASVGRRLVSREFWLHNRVTCLTAEGDAVHIVDRAVCELTSNNDIHEGCNQDEHCQPAEVGVAKIEWKIPEERLGNTLLSPAPINS